MKTDTQLQQDVIAELRWDPAVNAAQIGVEVKNGIVTLAGHVENYAEKWEAERAAQRVAGVRALAVEMDVRLPGASRRTDSDIARSAQNVLQWTSYLAKDAVKVVVENGELTLSGTVDWEYQRNSAASAVRYLMGVTRINNDISVRPAVSLAAVKSDIEAALKRLASADAHNIRVEVNGTDITLSGSVHSMAERDLARHSAWGTPGVHNVIDNLVVM